VLAVVVSDVEVASEFQLERRMFGGNPEQLRLLAAWLLEQEAEEVVMESTAQYWKPVWGALERYWKPIREKREGAKRRSETFHLAQAQSNRGRRGRKKDFVDAERLLKRLVARELTLSFVPDAEQRLGRAVTRKKYQLRRDVVRLNMLKTHYRQPIDWTEHGLRESRQTLRNWANVLERHKTSFSSDAAPPQSVADALLDDLNTPMAIAEMHKLAFQARKGDFDAAQKLHVAGEFLGIITRGLMSAANLAAVGEAAVGCY
jgi:hypothetical protein